MILSNRESLLSGVSNLEMDLLTEVYDLLLDEFLLMEEVFRLTLDLALEFRQLKLHERF